MDQTKPDCFHKKTCTIDKKISLCQSCSAILIHLDKETRVEALKTNTSCSYLNDNFLDIFEKMKERNYSPIRNIHYSELDMYLESRDDLKKCLWKVINKFQYYASTFYLALYFMDVIYSKYYDRIKLTKLDILCIGCVILASKFLENDPTVPALSKFNKFISNYPLSEVQYYEVLCLSYLDYKITVFTPHDILLFLLNHGVIFSDEDNNLIESNKAKGYYILNHSNKLEKLGNSCDEILELFFGDLRYLEFKAYHVAFACVALAREKNSYSRWSQKLELAYKVTYEEVKDCVDYIEGVREEKEKSKRIEKEKQRKPTNETAKPTKVDETQEHSGSSVKKQNKGDIELKSMEIKYTNQNTQSTQVTQQYSNQITLQKSSQPSSISPNKSKGNNDKGSVKNMEKIDPKILLQTQDQKHPNMAHQSHNNQSTLAHDTALNNYKEKIKKLSHPLENNNLTIEERRNLVENLRNRASSSLGRAPTAQKNNEFKDPPLKTRDRIQKSTDKEKTLTDLLLKSNNKIQSQQPRSYNNEEEYRIRNANKSKTTMQPNNEYKNVYYRDLVNENSQAKNHQVTQKSTKNTYNYSNYSTSQSEKKESGKDSRKKMSANQYASVEECDSYQVRQDTKVRSFTGDDEYSLKMKKWKTNISCPYVKDDNEQGDGDSYRKKLNSVVAGSGSGSAVGVGVTYERKHTYGSDADLKPYENYGNKSSLSMLKKFSGSSHKSSSSGIELNNVYSANSNKNLYYQK